MATDTVDSRRAHLRGITVTAVSALLGIAASFGSFVLASGPTDSSGVFVLAAAILIQIPVLQATGIKREFSGKDYAYVAFMTFALWFVSLTILYTANVSL
ncbi:hypothetical protein [Halomarina litorea]|uniref:EMC6-like membrane protein n=1 Tax=Halomarina litorea TaxID=2961595 RepID=UPI0020C22E38|nr:hypothetical protein [Halomarina sp. BCD28]